MCDLHLSVNKDVLQYKVLDFAIDDIMKKRPDCIAYAGDVTCDGNREVYEWFLNRMNGIGIPFLYIPGNSDMREDRFASEICRLASPTVNKIQGITVFALNDCERTISECDLDLLGGADENCIVFLHHPISSLLEPSRERMLRWRESHPKTKVFFAHVHRSFVEGSDIALQAMDPDKAIGENPCISYYDTETGEIIPSYFYSPVPEDLYKELGVSCYNVEQDIELAIKNGLKNLELRNITADYEKLATLVARWRESGGENLSMHLPDVCYRDGKCIVSEKLDDYIALAELLGVNRFTQHVPKVSVKTVREGEFVLESIAETLSQYLNKIKREITVGVENMHMTASESADETRRFGYLPEECLEFMEKLSEKCVHKVGINFDIGHARNNPPFSKTYQISTWMSMVGKYIVGYHLHQVNDEGFDKIKNHLAITEIYGRLISFASFFRCWADGVINKAPAIFEMRERDAYEQTLDTFKRYKK